MIDKSSLSPKKSRNHFLKHEKFDSAEFCFTNVIKLAPAFADAYYKRNLTMKWDEGPLPIEDLTKAIELKPNYGEAFKARAWRWNVLKKDTQALADYSKAIELLKNDFEIFLERGKIYLSLKDHKKALADFTSGIIIANNSWSLYVNRGQCEYEMKMYPEAKQDFTSAINIYGDGMVYYSRAMTEFRMGDIESAKKDKARAITVDNYSKDFKDSIPFP
jgi:tetratricopeptide (TPR) repeat protein